MIRVLAVILACQSWLMVVANVGAADRRWTDNTGNFSARASLVDFDPSEDVVTLRLADGRSVTLPLRRLSATDREFLVQAAEHQPGGRPIRIAGLDWYEDLKDARLLARGRPDPADDKPILCFRVLGDLEGFM